MKYRLALKLGVAGHAADGRTSGGALGWAVLRLGPQKTTGADQLPYSELEGPGEARVVVYDRPEDMLEPMPLDDFEQRIKALCGTLLEECAVVRVAFDRVAFQAWLAKAGLQDSHQARAEWANGLEL